MKRFPSWYSDAVLKTGTGKPKKAGMDLVMSTISLEQNTTTAGRYTPEWNDILEGCLKNDRAAQGILYKKLYGRMMGLCMRYLSNQDDALEVLNTGFLKVFQNLQQYSGQGAFEGWVYNIIRNAVIDHIRSRVKYREKDSLDGREEDHYVSHSGLQQLYARDLLKLLNELPETTRLVFNMFALEGYKHEEIAKTLGIQTGTSKWHVAEARKQLKSRIETLKLSEK
ncbi:MAG: RNA polymerase sigma factor [Bacteroidetes bacterium]|nr:RNA polymerase sigma factor [Bacteroidota bacterium]